MRQIRVFDVKNMWIIEIEGGSRGAQCVKIITWRIKRINRDHWRLCLR